MIEKPWFGMDPNSAHQLWSQWTFQIWDNGKHPPFEEVKDNARRWLRQGVGSVGRVRIEENVRTWTIIAQIEGADANDPTYVLSVRNHFQKNFVAQGWGPLAVGEVSVEILAGDDQTGRPRSQLIVMPSVTE